jgi:site-specific recombinase XerD
MEFMSERNRVSCSPATWNSSATTNTQLTFPSSPRFLEQKETERLVEFFAANIRDHNTRSAYARAVREFLRWTEARRITLPSIHPNHIASYMEEVPGASPTLKQKLAAIRMLFDWLVVGGMLHTNPTADARGPRPVVKVGKTSILTAQEIRPLLDSIALFPSALPCSPTLRV